MYGPSKVNALERLQRALDAIPDLKQLNAESEDFVKWRRDTKVAIANIFGDSSSQLEDFENTRYRRTYPYGGNSRYLESLVSATAVLKSLVNEIEDYWEDDRRESISSDVKESQEEINSKQVFIIHGQDHGTRDTVARFIENLGLEAIILQEQADQGATVIEKFERCTQNDFAVALFTPDDIGATVDGDLQPRARQNVIFELGYFMGKFGRDRVRALVKGNPELPSDYSGILYIPLDESGGWKQALVREMKSAGLDVDANLVF